MDILTVKKLTKKYGKFTAVSNVSFTVKKGEIFALIGPNGAGKSTILKTIATILLPNNGSIIMNKIDLVQNPEITRQFTTYLPEEAGAYKNMTGIEYLVLMASLYSDNKNDIENYVTYAKEICDLGIRLKDKISAYSKGMTRKLLLARAIMSKPVLAILDEPTSGLDIVNAMHIRNTIKDLSNKGMSVLLSSHNMLEIEYLSDRVAIMNNGKIIETGTPHGLINKYKVRNLEEVFSKLTQKNK